MFLAGLKLNFRHMLRQKECFAAFLFVIAVIFAPFFLDLFSFWGNDAAYRNPAWYYWGSDGTGISKSPICGSFDVTAHVIDFLLTLLLPFAAALAFGYAHYDNEKSGALKQLLPRVGAGGYFRSTAFTVFAGAFLVIFIPLLLEQLVLCLAFPWQVAGNVADPPTADSYITGLWGVPARYAALGFNHPYAYNLLLCAVSAATGGVLALCSYTMSLFFRKSRFLVLTLPGMLLWVIPLFVLANIHGGYKFVEPVLSLSHHTDFALWGLVAGGLLILNLVLLELKIHLARDEV